MSGTKKAAAAVTDAKPESEQVADATAASTDSAAPYTTAAAMLPEPQSITDAVPRRSQQYDSGLSRSVGLEVVPGSFAPATGDGKPVPHVRGPGQNPVDPVAAGLDVHNVVRVEDLRQAMTLTGRDVSGREPATYVEKTAGAPHVKDSDVAPTVDPAG